MKHKTKQALSILLSLALVLGLMPGISLTAWAGEKSGPVDLNELQVNDILGPDVDMLFGEGYTIVLQGGGYCKQIGQLEVGSDNHTMTDWQFNNNYEGFCFMDESAHDNYYPYANDEVVDSWLVVSVEDTTITLTGYVAPQSNNPFTQAVNYRQYSSSGVQLENGTLAANAGILVESDTVKWIDGNTYVVSGNVTIAKRVKVTGTVNLILLDGATLNASMGVSVNGADEYDHGGASATLNIYAGSTSGTIAGTGALVADARGSNGENAGLGGDERTAGGALNIHGGVITAYGRVCGAGIGGGNDCSHGTITIYDGTINATGGSNTSWGGAGIGGGFGAKGGTVYIYGGSVTVTGTGKSAGIGGGGSTGDGGSGGTVYIYGGTVTATAGNDSAKGIGAAQDGSSDGTLTLGTGVGMLVSTDNSTWTAYTNTRARYMKTGAAAATYNVTYDGNGADSGSVTDASSPYAENAEVTVLGNMDSLAKTGFVFAGWNTAADGSGTSYAAGDTFNITADTTLYAKWMAESSYSLEAGDTEVTVEGLDAVAAAEKENGKPVTVTMTVEKKSESENEEISADVSAIKNLNEAKGMKLDYLDISLMKSVDGTNSTLTETGTVLEIVVPYKLSDKKEINAVTVYRYHDTSATALTVANGEEKIDGTYRLDTEHDRIYIYASKFSTYAIGYTPTYKIAGELDFGSFTGTVSLSLPVNGVTKSASSTVNNGKGSYSFTGVPAGTYSVTAAWTESGKSHTLTFTVTVPAPTS